MPILVKNVKNNNFYFLLGTSYSAYKDSLPSFLGGALFPNVSEGEFRVAAVCNPEGNIEWFYADELRIIEIDGIKVSELYNNNAEIPILADEIPTQCPGCGEPIATDDKICKSCGLNLIVEENNLPYL
jgi:hypothetical protein